jgi:hypothetical protein
VCSSGVHGPCGGVSPSFAGTPLQHLNAAQRQIALQQQQQAQQQPQQQQQQQQQSDLLALLANSKAAAGHAGYGQGMAGMSTLAGTPANAAAAAAAGVQASSHALFGGVRPAGFPGGQAAGQGGVAGLGGLNAAAGAGHGLGGAQCVEGLHAAGADAGAAGGRGQQQQQQQAGRQTPSSGFNADEFPALGAVQVAAAAARGAATQQQQQTVGASPARAPGGIDYSAATLSLRKGAGVGGAQVRATCLLAQHGCVFVLRRTARCSVCVLHVQELAVHNDSDFPALAGVGDLMGDNSKQGQVRLVPGCPG